MAFFRKLSYTVTVMALFVCWLWYGLSSLSSASTRRATASLKTPVQAGVVEIPVRIKPPEVRRYIDE